MTYRHEWLEKWLNRYITIRNYCGAGRNHIEWIINAFKMGVYVIAGLFFIGIDVRSAEGNPLLLLTLSFIFLVGTYILGYTWDRIKGYEIEHQWGNVRDPMQREIYEAVKNGNQRVLRTDDEVHIRKV